MRFHPQFDHIVLLSAPLDVLLDRLATQNHQPVREGRRRAPPLPRRRRDRRAAAAPSRNSRGADDGPARRRGDDRAATRRRSAQLMQNSLPSGSCRTTKYTGSVGSSSRVRRSTLAPSATSSATFASTISTRRSATGCCRGRSDRGPGAAGSCRPWPPAPPGTRSAAAARPGRRAGRRRRPRRRAWPGSASSRSSPARPAATAGSPRHPPRTAPSGRVVRVDGQLEEHHAPKDRACRCGRLGQAARTMAVSRRRPAARRWPTAAGRRCG